MTAPVSVIWSAWDAWNGPEDRGPMIVERHESLLGPWADNAAAADSAINEIAEDWLNVEADDWSGDELWIEIHEPASIAGLYEIETYTRIHAALRRWEPANA